MEMRTISMMVGKGSVSHNSRDFHAKNTDPERTMNNHCYCNQNIEVVYKEVFADAVSRYNDKQKRNDRKIDNYYEKIRSGKQEKLFHEVIIQIGNWTDSSAKNEDGKMMAVLLNEYMLSFQKRNPYLKVFSAHLHMDEATPHLHIDFIPFTDKSTRGLDTRVSLKQALSLQGFKGGSRQETEWNQWVQSEKRSLAKIMDAHDIGWDKKGTHEKHLSVLDYKKEARQQEIKECETKIENLHSEIAGANDEAKQAKERLQAYNDKADEIIANTNLIETNEKFALPEPTSEMSAKEYSETEVKPLISRFKDLIKSLVSKYNDLVTKYNDLMDRYNEQQPNIDRMFSENTHLRNENAQLKKIVRNFDKVKKVFGAEKFETMIRQVNRNNSKEDGRNER